MQLSNPTAPSLASTIDCISAQFLGIRPGTCGKLSLAGLRLATGTASDHDLDLFEFGGEVDEELAEYREAALAGIEAILDGQLETRPPVRPLVKA